MFLQATMLDIHRNTHNLSTSKGSQSKDRILKSSEDKAPDKVKLYANPRARLHPAEIPAL